MAQLDEDLPQLLDLDRIRRRTASLRDEGVKTLLAHLGVVGKLKKPLASAGGDIETFILVKVLGSDASAVNDITRRNLQTKLRSRLRGYLDVNLVDKWLDDEDRLSTWKAARLLQALLVVPPCAFSRAAFGCLYIVIRELYSAQAPDWALGAARAGEGGAPTAFVSDDCLRSIIRFSHRLERLADVLEELSAISQYAREIEEATVLPDRWKKIEAKRLIYRLTALQPVPVNDLLINFPKVPSLAGNHFKTIRAYAEDVWGQVREGTRLTQSAARKAASDAQDFQEKETSRANRQKHDEPQSDLGHLKAMQALRYFRRAAKMASSLVRVDQNSPRWQSVFSNDLRTHARGLRNLLEPSRIYMSSLVDRELAAKQLSLAWDPGELAFAAVSYGWASRTWVDGGWHDERLDQAAQLLMNAVDENGRLPAGRPFSSTVQGDVLIASGAEVMRALVELARWLDRVEVNVEVALRMVSYFERLRKEVIMEEDVSKASGWIQEAPVLPPRPSLWATCLAVECLASLNKMLDKKINRIIFRHFTVVERSRGDETLGLNDLFYADYGLQFAPKKVRRSSVAIALERLLAHVRGHQRPNDALGGLHSLILHGPPGTGKTTLVEALAVSAWAPLVEVTPSDFVLTGAEGLEKRCREVMKALTLLTGAVILFDEFEPILLRRDPRATAPSSVFTFLTPGMLPKLKDLNEEAKRRRSAFVLITNQLGVLDEAAIRTGRFDLKLGIYPPCPLSRLGRLVSAYRVEVGATPEGEDAELRKRILKIVLESAGGPIQTLARPGWFTAPRKDSLSGSPHRFLFKNGNSPDWPDKEAILEGLVGSGADAKREWQQWKWIVDWEAQLKDSEREVVWRAISGASHAVAEVEDYRAADGEILLGSGVSLLVKRPPH